MTAYERGHQAGRNSMLYGQIHDNPFADCECTDCKSDAVDWTVGFSDGQESYEGMEKKE